MKKALNILLILLGFFFFFGCDEHAIPEDANTVNLFTINDTHGAFVSDDYPGMENVASVIKKLETNYGRFIKIANGDIFQGSYVSNIHFGLPLVEALNLLEFDCFVIGNHEFDWGLDKIAQYKDGNPDNGEANFPFLAANIVYKETGERIPWTEDYAIIENNGYRVGIIGIIGSGLKNSIASAMVADYEFLDTKPIVEELAYELRNEENCDAVVVAAHDYQNFEIRYFANLPHESRIDAIITGHTHRLVADAEERDDGYSVPVIQCDDKNESVGAVIIEMDEAKNPVNAKIIHERPSDYHGDKRMSALLDKYRADIEEGNRSIGYTPEYLSEGRIGRETAKAMHEKYGVDVAFINTGGVRESFKTGPIRIKDVFEVYPFDNRVVLTEVSGSQLTGLASQSGYLYAHPAFSSLEIDSNKTYRIATIDYVYTGSIYRPYFRNTIREDRELMRNVFIEYIEDFYQK